MRSDESKTCPKCRQSFRTDTNFCPTDGTRLNAEAPMREPHVLERTQKVADINSSKSKNSLVGQTLDGQYEILSLIGQGGMSIVYKARHLMLRKIVAIKTLLPHLVLHPHSLQRFQQEAQAASNIVHTNVVTIHNFGITPEGQPYLVMDYLEGMSLHELIEQEGHLRIDRALNIFVQVANALSSAHEKGVIHRDLKPSNIILIEQGEKKDIVQLVDFGIAKLLPREGTESISLTQTGEVFGSPLYMSPEQCRGEKLDARSDIYSMGCLMYETLCGRPPHTGDNTLEVLYKHINMVPSQISTEIKTKRQLPFQKKDIEDQPLPSMSDVKVPSALETIVFKSLAKSPESRYQSMDDLEKDLEAFQKSQQFSFLSVLKSRYELFQLKRGPQSKSDRATLAVWCILSVLALAGVSVPAVNFWNLAESPTAKQNIPWIDEHRTGVKTSDELDVMATNILTKEADEFLDKGRGAADEIYDSLIHAGKRCEEFGAWDDAATMFDKASRISIINNGQTSLPTVLVRLDLADAYYNQGKLREAEDEYEKLAKELDDGNRIIQYTLVTSRLGNCYFEDGNFAKAELNYRKSILKWRAKGQPMTSLDGKAQAYGLTGVSQVSLAALTFSRLAEILQMQADGRIKTPETAELDPETLYQLAAGCNFQALPMWRQIFGKEGKNTGLCQLHLAEDLGHLKSLTLSRSSPVKDTPQDKQNDMNVELLFQNAEEVFKSAYGSAHPYYAIALLQHSDFELRAKHDYKDYARLRFKACSILNSNKSETAK